MISSINSKFAWVLMSLLLVFPSVSATAKTITVGSKNFNESYLLAEMVAQLLESDGFTVDRKFGLGGTLVCYEALLGGEIDVYVEYTGTLEQVILKGGDLHPTVARLNSKLDRQLRLLPSIGFNNTYAIALKRQLADARALKTISDLAGTKDLRIAFSLEFLNREDGWPGLATTYGLTQSPSGIDHGLAYQAINDGKIDLTDAYSTDGDLARYDLVALKDDRQYFPDYFAAPLVRADLNDAALDSIGQLSGKISDDLMRELNGEVVVEGKSFAEVANRFLFSEGLVSSQTASDAGFFERFMGPNMLANTLTHLKLTGIALLLGCLIGLPLGIVAFRFPSLARGLVYVAGLLQTVPSIALLALMIPLFGIGQLPAIVALFLYSILPILRNTITGLTSIDPMLKRVAEAIGLSGSEQLRFVLIPMALPTILAGVKTAAVISIGTATLAAFIGAGGLGEPIVTGLALNDSRLILQGAIPAACLAILVELMFELLERLIVKPHMLTGEMSG